MNFINEKFITQANFIIFDWDRNRGFFKTEDVADTLARYFLIKMVILRSFATDYYRTYNLIFFTILKIILSID